MLSERARLTGRYVAGLVLTLVCVQVTLPAQIPGRNVNMVAGTEWPDGDPFLQRQNEPSLAASTRNPLHLLAGSNDYRTVDIPGLPDGTETGDAWLGLYKSFDGGQRWSSTLVPGYPQDTSTAGQSSPLKGYQAAADPVVRAGTSGLLYYNGLVFDRGENGKSGIFVSRFVDRNNKENGDPIAYLGTSMVAQSTGAAFLDKPWMAVDIPRGGNPPTCVVGRGPNGSVDRVAAGVIYVTYSSITGDGAELRSEILLKRSLDCGVTWSVPLRVSRPATPINQGATIAIEPQTGHLYVAWRSFAAPTAPDADGILVARLPFGGNAFELPEIARHLRRLGNVWEHLQRIFESRRRRAGNTQVAQVSELDQGTSTTSFRTNAYPSIAIDGAGRVHVAWAERGFAASRPDPFDGDARILIATAANGRNFRDPVVVDDRAQLGHQLMPTLAFAGGKLMLVFYDLRETSAEIFTRFVNDADSTNGFRHTIDIRAALGDPGVLRTTFAPSVKISDYLTGYRSGISGLEQLQVNPPNLPMFKLGTVPFIGDYIDVTPAPAFVPTSNGRWAYNTALSDVAPVFHAAWTDNRDVRPPQDGKWTNYTPPAFQGQPAGVSLFDPSMAVPVCQPGNAGSRNQNVYTSRIGGGLLVGSPGNSKPLSLSVQRGFVVFAHNQTTTTKTFRMTVPAQPPNGRASWDQFPLPPYSSTPPAPRTGVDVQVPPRSSASRTLYITASNPDAQVSVDISEVTAVNGGVVAGGLKGTVMLNPDVQNPDIENPDIENPDIENPDIENAEVYNPDIENPDIENPDIENPDIENPDIENPDIENVVVANPDIASLGIANPDIENPDIENPDIENPDIENPDIENGTISDVTWTVTNTGNTTSAFNVNLFLANSDIPAGLKTQLIVYKTYKTPVVAPNGCDLKVETRNHLLFNVPNPNFITTGEAIPDQNDPSASNATLWLAPGEVGLVTLRVYDDNTANNLTITKPDGSTVSIDPAFNPATVVTAGISAQGVDVLDPPGSTEPPVIVPPPSDPSPATVTLSNLAAIFDGSPKPVTATTNPPGLAVTLTYSGSSTPPSAIGAYAVRATVTQPGYVGSAGRVQTVASTVSGGGTGGAPFGPLSCGPGVFANGLRVHGSLAYALTSAQLLCANGIHPAKFGGATTPDVDLACPAGQNMVGIFGTTDGGANFGEPVVSSVGARCQPFGGGVITQVGPLPGSGPTFGPLDCPAGRAVTGVVGGQGAVVDGLALVCSPVSVP